MSGQIALFRLLGIRVTANWSWGVILLLVTGNLAAGLLPAALPGRSTVFYWGLGLLSALLFFVSLLAHELAHSLVARRYGLPVREIVLFVFGGVSNIEREAHEPEVELRMAAAGPVTSFALAAVCWLLAGGLPEGPARVVAAYLAVVNLAVGVFNLIPGFPLDGGRVLRAVLWRRWRDLGRATRVAANAGHGVGWGLIGLGVLQVLGGNFVGGLWFVLIGLFLQGAAAASVQQVALREHLAGCAVADVMTPAPRLVTVPPDLPVGRFVDDYLWRERHDAFPVRGADGAFLGLVGIDQVRGLDRNRWAGTPVQEVMRPAADVPVVSPEAEAVGALETMLRREEGRLPVVHRQAGGPPRLVGIVTRRDILHLLRLRTDLGGAASSATRAPRDESLSVGSVRRRA